MKKMKVPLLYLSLFSLVWAQSELQPHYKKAKQKCIGEHQITVKGRNTKHGYYVFQYMYSSLMPSNQTWVKKEEGDENISSGKPGPDKEKGPRKAIEDHTGEEKEEGHNNLVEMRNEDRRTSERTLNLSEHDENPHNWHISQHHVESIVDQQRNHTATNDTAFEIDGSGDMGSVGQGERYRGTISGKKHHSRGKDLQDTRDTEADILWGKDQIGQSGVSNDTKLSKDIYIIIGMKKNDTSIILETNLYSDILKKSKDSKSKDDLTVSRKLKNATNKEPGKEDGYADLLGKGKGENGSTKLQTRFNVQENISGDLLRKTEHTGNGGNYSTFADTEEIKNENGKVISYTGVHKKSEDEYAMIHKKLDGQENISGETKARENGEARGNIMSGKQTAVADVIKPHKKDTAKDDVMNGRSRGHMEAAGISETQKEGEGEPMIGRSISQVEKPVFTHRNQRRNQSRVILSGRLDGPGFSKPHGKSGEVTLGGGMSVIQGSAPGETDESKKGTSEVGIVPGKSENRVEGFHSFSAHQKKVDDPEQRNRNVHGGSRGDPERHEKGNHRLGVTFQESKKEAVKGDIGYRKAPGTADLSIGSSSRKADNSGRASTGMKSALTLLHRSHDSQHIAKSQEHSSHTLKTDGKVTKPSKKRSRVPHGRHRSSTAKRYRWHDKKGKSAKGIRARDNSLSSESDEDSRNDSRQSYEDYQNDNPESHQSAESAEENLSARSNESDNQSHVDEVYSQEDSQGHKST